MIKTPAQLTVMREAGRLLAQVFSMLDGFVIAGRSTLELDAAVEAFIRNDLKARPASLGQYDYPFSINTSINEVVCHGMPSAKDILKDGDIINIDITLEKGGFIADSSKMYMIGNVPPKARRLVEMTFEAMWPASAKSSQARAWAISAMRSKATRKPTATAWCVNTAATALAGRCMKSRRSCTSAAPAPGWNCEKAWCLPSSRCSTRAAPKCAA